MSTDIVFQSHFATMRTSFENSTGNFAILKIAIDPSNDDLHNIYQQKVETHNNNILNSAFPDSGFDLFVPEETVFNREIETKFIDFGIKAEMVYCDPLQNRPLRTGFLVHPRSSMSKTPLMLANHTGIIDAGYRGSLIGAFRWLRPRNNNHPTYTVEQNTRLVQVCHPSLCPIYVMIVNESDLSNTSRGTGGFGSTGVGL
jgi:dUTP pyrophosphatase